MCPLFTVIGGEDSLNVIPVIDLLNGIVVRGVAGEREKYQPNQSGLLDGCDPVETALAFREHFGAKWLYVADLDAIQGRNVTRSVIQSLVETGLCVSVDAGVSSREQAMMLIDLGVQEVIVALETLDDFTQIEKLLTSMEPAHIRFSIDLKNGALLGSTSVGLSPHELARRLVNQGIQKLVVLDLAAVGVGLGVPTLPLCESLLVQFPDLSIWTGGGVRGIEDCRRLHRSGIDGVMIASALHDGRLSAQEIRSGGFDVND